jgi:hypothetical protein
VESNVESLAALQREFIAALTSDRRSVLKELAHGRMLPQQGLQIYVHAYGARLRESLDNDHRQLGDYLGDELWESLCAGYIASHPSRYRSLRNFGDALPAYLRQVEPFTSHPEIAELAAFERHLLDCFDAAEAPHALWTELQAMPSHDWPHLCLRFQPSLQRHPVHWNSVEIWQALKSGQPPPTATVVTGLHWVIWRDAERVSRFRSLDLDEASALDHFLGGGSFGGFCELLLGQHPPQAVPSLALGVLQRWAADGWLARWAVDHVTWP